MTSKLEAGRTRAGHHHGSHTPTSPEAVLLGKMAYHTKQIRRQCKHWGLHIAFRLTVKDVYEQSIHFCT